MKFRHVRQQTIVAPQCEMSQDCPTDQRALSSDRQLAELSHKAHCAHPSSSFAAPSAPRQQWIQLRTIWFDNNHQFLHAHDILDPIILIWLSQKGNQSSETGRVPNITKSVVAPSLEMIKMCFQPKIALCRVKIHLTVFLSFAFHWFPVDPDRWFGTRRPTVENARKHTVGELF